MRSYLVRAKLHPIQISVGSFKCNGKRCQACMSVKDNTFCESNTFSSSDDKKEFVINHSFHCNGKCIIYLLICNKCTIQYKGKNFDDFRLRWNNCKDNNTKYLKKEACMQNTYLNTFQVRITVVFLMTSPLSLLIKLILEILINGNTTGNIPLK